MSAQECTKCAAGSYSLGSGVRFDEWDAMPAGFTSLPSSVENGPHGDSSLTCNRYAWQSDLQKTIKTVVELVSATNTLFFFFFLAVLLGYHKEATWNLTGTNALFLSSTLSI